MKTSYQRKSREKTFFLLKFNKAISLQAGKGLQLSVYPCVSVVWDLETACNDIVHCLQCSL